MFIHLIQCECGEEFETHSVLDCECPRCHQQLNCWGFVVPTEQEQILPPVINTEIAA